MRYGKTQHALFNRKGGGGHSMTLYRGNSSYRRVHLMSVQMFYHLSVPPCTKLQTYIGVYLSFSMGYQITLRITKTIRKLNAWNRLIRLFSSLLNPAETDHVRRDIGFQAAARLVEQHKKCLQNNLRRRWGALKRRLRGAGLHFYPFYSLAISIHDCNTLFTRQHDNIRAGKMASRKELRLTTGRAVKMEFGRA